MAQGGGYVFGQATPAANVPNSGTATYSGSTIGLLAQPSGTYIVTGDAQLTANFGVMTVVGALTNMKAIADHGTTVPWNDLAMRANIAADRTGYSGQVFSSSNSSLTPVAMSGSGIGRFYGPQANETAGTWSVAGPTGSNTVAAGSFGARKQ